MSDGFAGFPAEALHFMRDLSQNNSKEWFEAHKALYRETVQTPALALVRSLGGRLAAEFPPIAYDTRTNGGSLMRIYRDTRFSSDKTPYKTNIAMMFVEAGRKRMEVPGFGLQITLEQVDLVAGQFGFGPDQLERYRSSVLAVSSGAALVDAARTVTNSGQYTFGEPALKRVPRGHDADHPRAEWLRYKGLSVFSPPLSLSLVRSAGLVDAVVDHFRNMAPIWRWLEEYVA